MRSRYLSFLLPLAFLALSAAVLLGSNQARIDRLKAMYNLFEPPPLSALHPKFVKILLLGQKAVYDDFISIWLLQTLADQRMGKDADAMMKSIRSVIRHEPELETIYMLSCFVMMNDMNQPEKCQEITLAGLRAIPYSWRLPMIQGYVEYFKMKDIAKSAGFFSLAASRPLAPPFIEKLAKRLASSEDLSEDEIQSSLAVLSTVQGAESPLRKLLESLSQSKQKNP